MKLLYILLLWTTTKNAVYTCTMHIVLKKTTFDLLGCWNPCQAEPVPWWDGTMCDKPRFWKGSWTEAANYRTGGAEGNTWITGELLLSDHQGRKGKFSSDCLKSKMFSWNKILKGLSLESQLSTLTWHVASSLESFISNHCFDHYDKECSSPEEKKKVDKHWRLKTLTCMYGHASQFSW